MSEERNRDFLEGRDTAEQESPHISSSPEIYQDEIRDSPEVSREDAGVTELDSSKGSSSSPQEGLEECEFDELESLKGVSPPSMACSPPLEGAVGGTEHDLSDSTLDELNKIAAILNRCSMTSGKLRLFQMYFREPGMMFFVKPERRRRHNAGRQTSRQPPTDSTQPEEASGCEGTSSEIPMPILNQAGAVVGYTGPRPKREPTDNESEAGEQELKPEHSIGSAETLPIDEVYLPNFSSLFLPDENVAFHGCQELDSLSNVARETQYPLGAQLRQRKMGITQAVDIPSRPGSGPGYSGSFPNTRPVLLTRRYSLEFEPYVPSRSADQPVPERKISQDSSTSSGKHRSLSRESSVDLDIYMTSKLQIEADGETSTGNREFPSADSPHSLPVPDVDVSSVQAVIFDYTPASALDSAQMPVPQGSAPAATDEGDSPENI